MAGGALLHLQHQLHQLVTPHFHLLHPQGGREGRRPRNFEVRRCITGTYIVTSPSLDIPGPGAL